MITETGSTLACALATVAHALHHQWVSLAILIGSALFDGLLYLYVKDVVVCYRCNAHHGGIAPGPEHRPFELTVHERYRQERVRSQESGVRSQQDRSVGKG